MSLLLIHELKQQIERKEKRILELERIVQEHLQEHERTTKDTISDEILNKLKFSVQYTDYTYGNNTPVEIQIEYGGYLLSKIHLD